MLKKLARRTHKVTYTRAFTLRQNLQKTHSSTPRKMSVFSRNTDCQYTNLSLSLYNGAKRAVIHQTVNSYNTAKEGKYDMIYEPLSGHSLNTEQHFEPLRLSIRRSVFTTHSSQSHVPDYKKERRRAKRQLATVNFKRLVILSALTDRVVVAC